MTNKEFIKNVLKYSIPTIVSAIIALTVIPIVSRLFPEEEYGYITNYYSFGMLFMGLFLLGFDSAYIRFYNEKYENTNVNGMLLVSAIVGLLVSSIVFASCVPIHDKITFYLFNDTSFKTYIMFFCYILMLMMYRVLNITFRMNEKPIGYNIQQVSYIIINRLLFVCIAIVSTAFIYSAFIMTIGMGVLVVVSLLFQRKSFVSPKISKQTFWIMLKFALPLLPTAIIVYLNNSIAKFLLGYYEYRGEVGILALATSVANIFSIIPAAFTAYWGAFVYKNSQAEYGKIRKMHTLILLLSFFIILLVFVAQDLVYLLIGGNYKASQFVFLLVILGPVFQLLKETTTYGINLANKTKLTLLSSFLCCVVNALICYFLIPKIGMLAAAYGIAISSFLDFVLQTIFGQKYYRTISNYLKSAMGVLIIVSLCVLNTYFYTNLLVRIIAPISATLIIYLLFRNDIHALCSLLVSSIKKLKHKDAQQ